MDRITDLGPAPKYSGDPAEKIGFHEALERGYLVRPDDFNGGLLSLSRVWLLDERHRISGGFQDKLDLVQGGPLKTLTHFGLDLATDPLTWVPGAAYGKVLDGAKWGKHFVRESLKDAKIAYQKGRPIKLSRIMKETKLNADRDTALFRISRKPIDEFTYENHRWYGPSYVYKAEDVQKLRIAIDEKQLPLAASGQGASLAEDFKSSIVKGKEMVTEIAEARNALSSARKKKDISVKAHVQALIPDGQGGFKLVSGEGKNPNWRKMVGAKGEEGAPLNSFEKSKDAKGAKNWDQETADAEFASVEEMINENTLDAFKDATFHYSVSGLDVCKNCLKDIPAMARQRGLKEVFLYEESTGKILHWSRVTNLDSLQPLGRFISYNPQKLKAATIGVSQYNQQGKREGQ